MVQDKKLLQKFEKIMRMSNRVKQIHAAKMMKISHDKLLELLFEWGDDLSFKIEDDSIVITDSEEFTSEVDALYDDWESKEITGEGKITDIDAEITMDPPFEAQNKAAPKKKSTHAVKSKKEYLGTELFGAECDVLEEIESLLEGEAIPKVDEVKYDTFGFTVRNNHVTGLGLYKKGLATLPESIGSLSNLKKLSLYENNLTKLPESLGSLSNLKELYLYKNKLSTLPESISKLSNLTYLSLSSNNFETLPESIGQLSNLEELDLGFNELKTLPESISKLSNLKNLNLSWNKLTKLPESIGSLSNLKKLSLYENNLTKLPESIGSLSNLKKLGLQYDKLTKLPESISQLSNLKELFLHENKLTKLPESIGALSNLKVLKLYNNYLTKLPESLVQLSKLSNLDVKGNPLDTKIIGKTDTEKVIKALKKNGCKVVKK